MNSATPRHAIRHTTTQEPTVRPPSTSQNPRHLRSEDYPEVPALGWVAALAAASAHATPRLAANTRTAVIANVAPLASTSAVPHRSTVRVVHDRGGPSGRLRRGARASWSTRQPRELPTDSGVLVRASTHPVWTVNACQRSGRNEHTLCPTLVWLFSPVRSSVTAVTPTRLIMAIVRHGWPFEFDAEWSLASLRRAGSGSRARATRRCRRARRGRARSATPRRRPA